MAIGSGARPRSLRRRIAVWITGSAALAALVEALLLFSVWYGYEERVMHRVVRDELRRSLEIHPYDPRLAQPNTGSLTLHVLPRRPGPDDPPVSGWLAPLRDLPGADGDRIVVVDMSRQRGPDFHVAVALRGDLAYMMVYDSAEHDARRANLAWALAGILLLVLAMAAWMAQRIGDHLFGSLGRLQQRILEPPASGGLRDEGMDVEVAALADALDAQRAQVQAALRKERAFAAAASHELRTPLTRIATGVEVLLAQDGLDAAARERLRRTREAADELQRLLDVLLRVARTQTGEAAPSGDDPAQAPRPLGEVVRDCVDRLSGEARLLGASVTVDLGSPERSVRQAAMLEVVLGNLLRNAIRHGRSAPVVIRERDAVLEVIDAGPGIDGEAIGRVFDPFWRGALASEQAGSTGLGLGLTIVERICAVAGWGLEIRSDAGRGTCARIRLEGAPRA